MIDYSVVTRAGWNARPPTSRVQLDWSRVDKFITHYSGALRTQSVRSIQNYCMDSKGHSDIDYNDLVRDGVLFEGRGPYIGGHTLGLNSSSYGVCIIGRDGDATDDDFNTVRTVYDKACAHVGRILRKLGHRTALPNHTSCPGDEIQSWVDAGMPYRNIPTPTPVEDDVFCDLGDVGEAVKLMQRRVLRAGGSVGLDGDDGEYGNNTAAGLAAVLGFGDGKVYGAIEVDTLDELLRVRTASGVVVPPPLTTVKFTIPAQEIIAAVIP